MKIINTESSEETAKKGQQYTLPVNRVFEPQVVSSPQEEEKAESELSSPDVRGSQEESYDQRKSRNISQAQREEMLRKTDSHDDYLLSPEEDRPNEEEKQTKIRRDEPEYQEHLAEMQRYIQESEALQKTNQEYKHLQNVPERSKESQDQPETESEVPSEQPSAQPPVQTPVKEEVKKPEAKKPKPTLAKSPSLEEKKVKFKNETPESDKPEESKSRQAPEEERKEVLRESPKKIEQEVPLEMEREEEEVNEQPIPEPQEEDQHAEAQEQEVEVEAEEEREIGHGRYQDEEEESEEENLSRFGNVQDYTPYKRSEPEPEREDDERPHLQQPEEAEGDDHDDVRTNQSFGRHDPTTHVEVSNQDQDILDFKNALDLKYQAFKRVVVEKYHNIRLDYLQQLDFAIRESERENNSAIDFMEQQVEEATNERDAARKRATESRIILANVMREKYNTFFLKRACFQSWKYFFEWKKYKIAKAKFCDNYYKKRSKQKFLNGWRKVSHEQFLQKAFKIRDEYELQQRTKIFNIDNKIENLMLYLAQLQSKIEEETGLILEIPDDYMINTGLQRIKNETEILRQTDLFEEVRMTQAEAIFKS